MTEREQFIQKWEREFQTTLKVLKSYPDDKRDLRPHAKSPSAIELAWKIVEEEPILVNGSLTGKFEFEKMSGPPSSMNDVITKYETNHRETREKLRSMSDDDFMKMIKFMVAPKTMGDVRSADTLWMLLMDSVHHRGQLSVYLRMAGGKVPSIYGPSADEPWM